MAKEYKILKIDPYLKPFEGDINLRMEKYREARQKLTPDGDSLSAHINGHLFYGFHQLDNGWVYREWAPGASGMSLIGDFNNWNRDSHPMTRIENGSWELFVAGELPHGSRVRVIVHSGGTSLERIPLYCKRVTQEADNRFNGIIWNSGAYEWRDDGFKPKVKPLYIYECHIGMAGEGGEVASFKHFSKYILPRVKRLGYNAIQVMAIMEHPYYGSFGYQVSNFFAVSSRFGNPEDLKELVDTAHGFGIAVIMDIVHSHTVRNTVEGLCEFDGTDYQFCHSGTKGDHPAWDTRLFDYSKPGVLNFLLSNVKYWLEEYHLDGFRFDGVTSMLYHDHGLGTAFDSYNKYFSLNTDIDAVNYLQLASELCKELKPDSILISEDMSGMPGMCLPISDGGIGFDYRLNMGLPDFFIKMMKENEQYWHLGSLWHELTSRRPKEKVVGYTESHDQALVGDKTIMFWLADSDMYWHMSKDDNSERIDRAMSLHKMLRFITCAAGGDGYLNFMGNEFGHPEWIDFPREGNGWSHHYARRQWNLADNPDLKYSYLQEFDAAMLSFVAKPGLRGVKPEFLMVHEENKLLAFTKGDYTFIFNFHHSRSYKHSVPDPNEYELVFHSAWQRFGGFVNEKENEGLVASDGFMIDRRCAVVLKRLRKNIK